MLAGIYKITSPTGRIYIGQSSNLKERKKHYKGLKCKRQPIVYNSLKKYGFDKHDFVVLVAGKFNKEQLYKLETHYIKKYNSFVDWNRKGMNCTTGDYNRITSNKTKQKMLTSRRIQRDLGNLNNKLTKKQVVEIKKLIALNYERRQIGKDYNVSETTIAEIVAGRNWKDVPDYIVPEHEKHLIRRLRSGIVSTEQKEKILNVLDNTSLSYKNIGTLFDLGTKSIHYYARRYDLLQKRGYPIQKKEIRYYNYRQYLEIKLLLDLNIDESKIKKVYGCSKELIQDIKNNEYKYLVRTSDDEKQIALYKEYSHLTIKESESLFRLPYSRINYICRKWLVK